MAKAKTQPKIKPKPQFRDGTLGWWLMEAGWEPIEQVDCPRGDEHRLTDHKCEKCREIIHYLWRLEGFDNLLTGWEARRLELLRIHNDFKAKAREKAAA